MAKFVTIVGSRKLKDGEEEQLYKIAKHLAEKGYIIRHGAAVGADTAGHLGAYSVDPSLCEVYTIGKPKIKVDGCFTHILTEDEFKIIEGIYLEKNIIPWYDKIDIYGRKLHCRNFFQVYGLEGVLSEMVIYVANESNSGNVSGGTRTAVELARLESVPTFNLRINSDRERLDKLLGIDTSFRTNNLSDLFG